MISLNEDKGTTISELELTLKAIRKLLDKKIEESPNSGVVMAKGKKNEAKLRYADMRRVVTSLESKLSAEGCMSFGVCKTCTKFNKAAGTTGYWGECANSVKHEYDSCSQHSKIGGGFGI